MNEHATDLDQADEDILTYDVSDEALEAAAGSVGGASAVLLVPLGYLAADLWPRRRTTWSNRSA
jgi:hypothetical protein